MSKILTGIVTSTKMNKTVVVKIERVFRHPIYRKVIRRHKKFKAHVDGAEIREGDVVEIKEVRPISKDKHFIVVKKVS